MINKVRINIKNNKLIAINTDQKSHMNIEENDTIKKVQTLN